jgi:hypothetical protein
MDAAGMHDADRIRLARSIRHGAALAHQPGSSTHPILEQGRRPAESALLGWHDALLTAWRPIMLTMPEREPTHRLTIMPEPGDHAGASGELLSPAQRIALTIALINHGFDLLDGVARTSLAGCARVAFRSRHRTEPAHHPLHQG